MSIIFEECKSLKAKLDALRPLKKEDEDRIMQKFRLDWNYHSNHLEGNSLTFGETKALILFGITAQGKPLKDHFEVTGHNDAIDWILSLVKQDRPLNEMFVRELHTLILKEPYEINAITPDGLPTKKTVKVGEYKSSPNHVKTKTGEIFRFATPEDTPILMNELIEWYNKKVLEKEYSPILLAAEFHYRYIRIHPFDDGNGRTARILMNFILLRFGYPPVIIRTEDKENYFSVLRQADAGVLEPFIKYIAENLKHSLKIMIAGAKGESIEEKDDLEKEIALLQQSVNSVGKSVNITKDSNTLLALFEDEVLPVCELFKLKSNMMSRFYLNTIFIVNINGVDQPYSKITKEFESKIKDNRLNEMRMICKFETFNNLNFNETNYETHINFRFRMTKYIVSNSSGFGVEKLYGENLTEPEIKSLIDETIIEHKEIIQRKVDSLRNK